MEMHCLDLQYDTTNNTWLTASFDDARQRCNDLGSTLIIIKDDETNSIVQDYISESSPNPIRNRYIWTDAYRINNYNNSYPWNWLNSKLPNKSSRHFERSMPLQILSRIQTSRFKSYLSLNRRQYFHNSPLVQGYIKSEEGNWTICSRGSKYTIRVYELKNESVNNLSHATATKI